MNCKTFMRKLPDFLENSMMHDMREAMEKHMSDCESCKKKFDEEKELDLAFTMALEIEDISFNSCRTEIMKNINKNKYSKSPISKIRHGLSKFQIQIVSTAAVFFMTLLIAPHIMDKYGASNTAENKVTASISNESNQLMTNDSEKVADLGVVEDIPVEKKESIGESLMADNMKVDNDLLGLNGNSSSIYVPEFTKVELEVNENLEFATDWVESPDKSMKVAIEGRGPEAAEQGVGKLVFINNNTSKMWKLSLANNESKQFTPMKVSWYDNDNLLVIFGYGQGRVTLGGDVILLNANSSKAVNIYWEYSLDSKKQVVDATRRNDKIDLKVIVYDDMVNKFKEEFRSIAFGELYNNNNIKLAYSDVKKEHSESRGDQFSSLKKLESDKINAKTIKSLELLEDYVNEKNYKSISAMFSEDLLNQEDYLQLLQVQGMDITRVINVSNTSSEGVSTSIYYVEALMDMKEESSLYKTGTNFLSISVQNDEKGNVIITDIERLPQN